jgi:hypothetical protein
MAKLTADATVSSFIGDCITIYERFSGGGGESELLREFRE